MLNLLRTSGVSLSDIVASLLASLMLIFLVSPLHEMAHGFAAVKLGDNTPRYQGRLTLNPFAHVDWMGALLIVLFGFGWAKPVQVNMYNFKNPKRDMAITALAGPLSNIIAAFVAGIFFVPAARWANGSLLGRIVYLAMQYFVMYNLYIAFFNLIPIPPLDGSRILSAVLPNRYYYSLMRLERYSFIIIVLLFSFTNVGYGLSRITGGFMNIFYNISNLIF